MEDMVAERSWDEFRKTGMLWWANSLLHIMGWAIVTDVEHGEVVRAYPARVKFRGFGDKEITDGFQKVSLYMMENAKDLYIESCE